MLNMSHSSVAIGTKNDEIFAFGSYALFLVSQIFPIGVLRGTKRVDLAILKSKRHSFFKPCRLLVTPGGFEPSTN
jgi:hypothetical protein